MSAPKFRKAFQATLYRYENARCVDSLEIGVLFATSAEARLFAQACYGFRCGLYNTITVATKHVPARQYESVVSLSVTRAA